MKLDNEYCPHGCNSLGQFLFKGQWHPCPIHGIKKDVILRGGSLPDGTSIYDVLRIPKEYKGEWVEDEELLFKGEEVDEGLKYCTVDSIRALKNILQTVYNVVAIEKSVYPVSLYLYGSMVDLKPWVYTLQRIGMENGMSVLPATSVNELAGIISLQDYPNFEIKDEYDIATLSKYNRVAAIGADWYLQTKLSYVDYLRASLVFIFDDGATSMNNLKMLAGFVEERARRGLPTYVVSTTFLGIERAFLSNTKNQMKYSLSKLTPYQLVSKRIAGETAKQGLKMNGPVKDLEGVVGQNVKGRSADYF